MGGPPLFGEDHRFGDYHDAVAGPGNGDLNGTVTVNQSTNHNLNMNGDHHQHRGRLTKSQSQPSLSEMLAMNVSPEQFEQFQAMKKGQNARYEPTITDAIQEDGVF